MASKAETKKKLIIDTTKQFIIENDFTSLTLDAIAEKANISKGGLLYHFPNKEELIMALGEATFDEFEDNFYQSAENDPVETGKWSRALIEIMRADIIDDATLNIGVVAASILDQEEAKTISTTYNSILEKLDDDGLDPLVVDMIRLTLDGLYYSQTLDVAPLPKDRVERVIQELLTMTKSEG